MVSEADLNLIVSHVVNENHYSHCRLCLRETPKDFVRFEDCVSYEPSAASFWRLSEIMTSLLGDEVVDVVPGVDAVCTECVERLLHCHIFIEKCKQSTQLLHKIFTDVTESLSVPIEPKSGMQLYVIVGEHESKVQITEKICPKKKKGPKRNKVAKTKSATFNCTKCGDLFSDFAELKEHNLNVHETVTCEKCAQTFTDDKEMDAHCKAEHGFKCSDCNQYKDSEESLKEHIVRLHQPCVCQECGKTYKGLDKLQIHEEKHKSAKSVCPKCGKHYVIRETYENHVRLCLNNLIEPHPFRSSLVKTYTCNICGKGYSTSGGLRVHERFTHEDAKPHVCEICGKKFTAPSYLKTHLVTHTGEKNFKCDLCSLNLVSKEALLYHRRRHLGEKPYSCKQCNERFVNASARAEHVKFKHTGPTLSCQFCDKKFFTRTFLRQHISRHNDPSSKLYIEKTRSKCKPMDDMELADPLS